MKKIILFFLIFLSISSCDANKQDDYGTSEHYIFQYVYDVASAEIISYPEGVYRLCMDGTTVTANGPASDPAKQKYNSLAKQFNDVSFNKSILWIFSEPVLADTLTQVNFTCRQAFDQNHPANSHIDDLIKVSYTSVREYVESGYKLPDSYKVTTEMLPSFNEKNHILIDAGLSFYFVKKPVAITSCSITCEGYSGSKKIFEVSNIYRFD